MKGKRRYYLSLEAQIVSHGIFLKRYIEYKVLLNKRKGVNLKWHVINSLNQESYWYFIFDDSIGKMSTPLILCFFSLIERFLIR